MARVTGLEPATSGVTGRHSNQLSYTRAMYTSGPQGRPALVMGGLISSPVQVKRRDGPAVIKLPSGFQACLRAVTSISIFIAGSASPHDSMVAAGRTSPNHFRKTGQHGSKSAASGKM